jgi:hypothetical protein
LFALDRYNKRKLHIATTIAARASENYSLRSGKSV